MGIFLGRDKISGTSLVALTEAGKRTAEKYSSRGATFVILSALCEKSPMTVSELALATQIELSEAKQRVKVMSGREGLVRVSGSES